MKDGQNRSRLRNCQFAKRAQHWLVPLLICIATAMTAHAQTLHTLLVIMDADLNVGSAMEVNALDIHRFLTQVEKGTGLQVKMKTLLSSQNQARKSELIAWLDTRKIADEDVLFVYFSGKGRFTAPVEHLYLQDGGMTHTEVSKKVQSAGTGRLTLLITDRCDTVLERLTDASTHQRTDATPARPLEDLFKEHKGFLHLTSATGQEPGWADTKGGFFTQALLHAIQHQTDARHQDFTSWQDIFDDTRQKVKANFDHSYPDLADSLKEDLRNRGIWNQTPKAYRLPTSATSPSIGRSQLWDLKNPEANFAVDIETDQADYLVEDLITFEVKVTDSAAIFIFNWDTIGNFACVFPNRFETANFLAPGKIWAIPPEEAKYELAAEPPPGY